MRRDILEIPVQDRLIASAKRQGWWISNTNDRFVSAKPDLRISNKQWGQIDVELKVVNPSLKTIKHNHSMQTGLTKLQFNEIRDMNLAGAPAVCMVLIEPVMKFVLCNDREIAMGDAVNQAKLEYDHSKKFDFNFAKMMTEAIRYLGERYK